MILKHEGRPTRLSPPEQGTSIGPFVNHRASRETPGEIRITGTTETSSELIGHSLGVAGEETLNEQEERWFAESQERFKAMNWFFRPRRVTLYIILALHTLSSTLTMGALAVLKLNNICSSNDKVSMSRGHALSAGVINKRMTGSSMKNCSHPNSMEELSNLQTILAVISGLLGIFLSGRFGQISDKYGRVFVFKIFSVINFVQILSWVFYFRFHKWYNRPLLIVLSSIGYLNGGIMTLIANGNAYINDIVVPQKRTISISFLMFWIYIMTGIGPVISSATVYGSDGNNLIPLYLAIAFSVFSALLIFTCLPEPRHPEAMRAASEIQKNKTQKLQGGTTISRIALTAVRYVYSLVQPIGRFWIPKSTGGSLRPRFNVITLLCIDLVSMAATVGTFQATILYSMAVFRWTAVEVGAYIGIGGFGKAVVLLLIGPIFLKFLQLVLKMRILTHSVDFIDRVCIVTSLIFVFLSVLLVVTLKKALGLYLNAVFQSLSAMISPTIQSAIVKYSSRTDAGEMFGAIALMRHLAMLIFPAVFLQIFAHTATTSPGAFFWIPLAGSLLTLIVALVLLRTEKHEDQDCAPGSDRVVIPAKNEYSQ